MAVLSADGSQPRLRGGLLASLHPENDCREGSVRPDGVLRGLPLPAPAALRESAGPQAGTAAHGNLLFNRQKHALYQGEAWTGLRHRYPLRDYCRWALAPLLHLGRAGVMNLTYYEKTQARRSQLQHSAPA
jgi:hypothetical protein